MMASVVDVRHLPGVEPAGIAAQQVGQHGSQVQGFAVDLDAQGEQPGAFALGQMQLLYGALARAERPIHLFAQQFPGVGGNQQFPAQHGNAFMRKTGLHHHAPALGLQTRYLIGPEISEKRFLRQRPQRSQAGGRVAVAPLQRPGVHRQQAQVPHQVHGVGLGRQVALHAHHGAARVVQVLQRGGARIEDGGGRRRLPHHGVGASRIGAVGPVDLRQRHAVAARAHLALRLEAQQPVAPAQGHQRDAGAEVAEGDARWGWRATGGERWRTRWWVVTTHGGHHPCGLGIRQRRQRPERSGVGLAAQGGHPGCDDRLAVGSRRCGLCG